jgi:hypothetical protein
VERWRHGDASPVTNSKPWFTPGQVLCMLTSLRMLFQRWLSVSHARMVPYSLSYYTGRAEHSTKMPAFYTVFNANSIAVNRNIHGRLHQRLGCGAIPRLVILRHGACDKSVSRAGYIQRSVPCESEMLPTAGKQASKVCATFK